MGVYFGKRVVDGGRGVFLKLSVLLLVLNLVLCLSGEARAGKESIFEIKNLNSDHKFIIPKGESGNFTVGLLETYCSESFATWVNETKKKLENDLFSIAELESGIISSSSFYINTQSDGKGGVTWDFHDFEGNHRIFDYNQWKNNVGSGEKKTRNYKSCYYIKDLEQINTFFVAAAKASIKRIKYKQNQYTSPGSTTHSFKEKSSKGTATTQTERNATTYKQAN